MEQKQQKNIEDLLQKLLIVELAREGIPQSEIQKIVGVDIHRINRIARHFKARRKR